MLEVTESGLCLAHAVVPRLGIILLQHVRNLLELGGPPPVDVVDDTLEPVQMALQRLPASCSSGIQPPPLVTPLCGSPSGDGARELSQDQIYACNQGLQAEVLKDGPRLHVVDEILIELPLTQGPCL